MLLSSVVWDFSPVFSKMIDDVVANKFGSQLYSLSLADDSLKLLKSKGIPDNVWAHIMAEREKLISGAVKVERIHDAQKVRAMMSSTSIAAQ